MATSEADTRLALAEARMKAGWEAYSAAHDSALTASAEYFRLALLELAGRHPGLEAFEFSCTYEYDDEGGYFPSIYATAVVDVELPAEQKVIEEEGSAEDEVLDLGIDAESVARLCDVEGDSTFEAKITVERLKALAF